VIRGDQATARRYLSSNTQAHDNIANTLGTASGRRVSPATIVYLGATAVYGETAAVPVNFNLAPCDDGLCSKPPRYDAHARARRLTWRVDLNETGRQMLRETNGAQ